MALATKVQEPYLEVTGLYGKKYDIFQLSAPLTSHNFMLGLRAQCSNDVAFYVICRALIHVFSSFVDDYTHPKNGPKDFGITQKRIHNIDIKQILTDDSTYRWPMGYQRTRNRTRFCLGRRTVGNRDHYKRRIQYGS